MTAMEERLQVLKMVQDGKVTPDEAAQLLEALDATSPIPDKKSGGVQDSTSVANSARWFRIKITDTDTGRPRVNVRMPLAVVKAGLKMGMRFSSPDIDGLNVDQLSHFIDSGALGQIVDVMDEADGEHVEIFIE